MKNWILTLALLGALGGCASTGGGVTTDRVVTVKQPVPQPCAGQRPAAVTPLREKYPAAQWGAMDVKQKAAAVGAQGLERQTYGEQLDAATGACP